MSVMPTILAALFFLCGGRRVARAIDHSAWRAAEEFGCAVAPLLVFALLWLLAESPQRPNGQAPLA